MRWRGTRSGQNLRSSGHRPEALTSSPAIRPVEQSSPSFGNTGMLSDGPVGLVGLGLVGQALARRFILAGYGVVGQDLDRHACDAARAIGVEVVGEVRARRRSLHDDLSEPAGFTAVDEVVWGRAGLSSVMRRGHADHRHDDRKPRGDCPSLLSAGARRGPLRRLPPRRVEPGNRRWTGRRTGRGPGGNGDVCAAPAHVFEAGLLSRRRRPRAHGQARREPGARPASDRAIGGAGTGAPVRAGPGPQLWPSSRPAPPTPR